MTKGCAKFALALSAIALIGGEACADTLYRGFNMPWSTDTDDIVAAAALGINTVRLQLSRDESADTETVEEYLESLQTQLDYVVDLLPVFDGAGIDVILDNHTPPGRFGYCGNTTSNFPQAAVFCDEDLQTAFLDGWAMILDTLIDAPSSERIIGLEIMSEPPTGNSTPPGVMTWDELAQATAELIRNDYEVEIPIIKNAAYANPTKLKESSLLEGISDVLYGFNFYPCPNFANQDGDPVVHYPSAGSTCKKGKKAKKKKKATGMYKLIEKAIKFQKNFGVDVVVGEMAVSRHAPDDEAAQYLRDMMSIFEEYGVQSYSYHAWRESDFWSVELDADGNTAETLRKAALQEYFELNQP